MKFRVVLIAVLFVAACQRQRETRQPSQTRRGVTTTTIAAPPANLMQKKVVEQIPFGPNLLDSKGIGPKLAADGTVSGEVLAYKPTDPVNVTMRFHESQHGLQSSVRVEDPKGKEVYRTFREMNGGKLVTFTIPPKKLKRGHYKVEGYWGGNVAVEWDIDVK